MRSKEFTQIGYLKEYYDGHKLMAVELVEIKDREVYGYFGRIQEVATHDIKKVKAGKTYTTILYPLNGKTI